MSDPSRLQWPVAESGYRWVRATPVAVKEGRRWVPILAPITDDVRAALGLDGAEEQRPHSEWYLTPRTPRGSDGAAPTVTHPLKDHPKLFEELACVDPTKDGIQDFADRNGLLGGEQQLVRPDRKRKSQGVLTGEPISSWQTAISHMRLACHFQQQLNHGEVPKQPTTRPFTAGKPGRGVLDRRIGDLAAEDFWSLVQLPADPTTLDTTRGAIQMVANSWLREGVTASLIWHDEWRQYTLRLVPTHLLGAMWFQFAESIAKNLDYSKCETCGKWLEVSTGQSGVTKRTRFCSDRCRVEAHRKQRAEVSRLARAGVSIADIARRTGKKAEQVKKWTQESPRRKPPSSRVS